MTDTAKPVTVRIYAEGDRILVLRPGCPRDSLSFVAAAKLAGYVKDEDVCEVIAVPVGDAKGREGA